MTEILAIILGGGAAAMVTACVAAYRSIKDGSRVAEKDAVADLEKWRATSDDRREQAEIERDYWRLWAGQLVYKITSTWGPDELPQQPPMPEFQKSSDGENS